MTMKEEFLAIKTPEEFMSFQDKYRGQIDFMSFDKEMQQKLSWIIRQAPGSCGTQSGVHEECFQRKK